MPDHADAAGAAERRLDGWKAISRHFNRDRSTVMRWAQDRGMPVHRVPGGRQGSVFAFADELDWWSRHGAAPALPVARPRHGRIAAAATIGIVGSVLAGLLLWPRDPPDERLPADATVAADYLTARDLWAHRTAADGRAAIALLQGVIAADPAFAPAHAALADAWLTAREYGAAEDADAFAAARSAAARALAIDGDLAAAHRAAGFVAYWWDGDSRGALAALDRAVALDGDDAQTHLWRANILADIGDDGAAQADYARARLLAPGTAAIETEQAWSHWIAGRDDLAERMLTTLAHSDPQDATVHDALSWIRIGRGDIAGFARHHRAMAMARGQKGLIADADALDAGLSRNPATAHRILVDRQEAECRAGRRRTRQTPAFIASAMADRDGLLRLLDAAVDGHERWTRAAVRRRIARRWAADAAITQRLARLVPTGA